MTAGTAHGRICLGINAAYHELSASLLIGGALVHAVQEVRLSRVKHAKAASVSNPDELPWRAIRECLDAAGLAGPGDCSAFSSRESPHVRVPNPAR